MKASIFLILLVPAIVAAQTDTIVFRQQLDSVVLRSVPPLVRQTPAGIIVNPQSSLLTRGSNVLQTLERAPGVTLDYRNGGVTLNGKSGVRILVDGKGINLPPDQVAGFLEGLNAENVERIEILTTPGAGLDAEGTAVINIIRKKNRRQGTTGSATITAGYGYREKTAARFQLAHKNRTLNLYGNYAFALDKTYSDMYISSEQDMPVYGGKLNVLVFDTTRTTHTGHDASAGVDITLSPSVTIGGSVNLNSSARRSLTNTREDFFIEPDSTLLYSGVINTNNRWNNVLNNIYFEKQKNNRTFSATADYLLFKNDFPSSIVTTFRDRQGNIVNPPGDAFASNQKGEAETRIRVAVLKVDYKILLRKTRLETGIKGAYTRSNSESGISGRMETFSAIVMNENIGAAYASVARPVGPTSEMVIGARYEYSSTIMNDPLTKERLVTRTGGNFFPNVSFTRRLKENESLSLTWAKRITRPAYTDLASYVRYSDPTAVYVGNPLLKPSIAHNVDVRYARKDLSFALLASLDKNMLVRYQITENPERTLLYVSPQNLAWQQNVLLQAVVPIRINEWWNLSTTLTGGWRKFKAVHTLIPVTKDYLLWNVNAMSIFRIAKNFSAELSGWLNSVGYNGSIRTGKAGVMNGGIKKELNKNRGTVQFTVSDIFTTMKFTSRYGTVTRDAFDVKNKVEFYTESAKFPVFRLTYTRSFGSTTGKNRSQSRLPEEKARLGE